MLRYFLTSSPSLSSNIGGSISIGIMASVPYTNVKGGSLVEDCAV
ncbi:hypothetical protein A2U01_0105322, partial [Trifolium medium]|nr:hypothetical protein [Trifolium medium]